MPFDNVKGKLSSAANAGANFMGAANNTIADAQMEITKKDTGNHTMFERFSGGWITFAITDNSLVYGKDEYPYEQLEEIVLTIPPSNLRAGAAETKVGDKTLLLQYALGQADRFAVALSYANEQIARSKGLAREYRYAIQTPRGNRIEAFDTYLMVYAISGGLFGDTVSKGQVGHVMEYSNISLDVKFDAQTGEPSLNIRDKSNSDTMLFSTTILHQDVEKANAISELVKTELAVAPMIAADLTPWKPFERKSHIFTLDGESLTVGESLDFFNTLRRSYFDYAEACVNAGKAEYSSKVRDLVTCMQFFPRIYEMGLNQLIAKAVDALIINGIYTITADEFEKRHSDEHHIAMDFLKTILDIAESASQANVESTRKITSLAPRLIGGGFGTKGAIKGILKAEAFNLAMDYAENSMLESASKISPAQARELYARINPDALFAMVFADYWSVHLTLAQILNENDRPIWIVDDVAARQAESVFQNMANPYFPQDQLTKEIVNILKANPYRKKYHRYIIGRYDDSDEAKAICSYFGFDDFNDARLE